MLAVATTGLGKSYRSLLGGAVRPGLRPLDLIVPAGQRVAIAGPNGSGKSTLLRLLATVLRPSTGSARILGHDLRRRLAAIRREIAYVGGEGQGLDPRLTGRQNAVFRSALYGLGDATVRERLAELTAVWQLQDLLDRPVTELSTGERQRLAIALALLPQPRLLLLDEPTRSLDPRHARDLWRWLKAEPLTVLWASHDPAECLQEADRLLILHTGALRADGTAAELAPGGRADLLRWYAP